MTAPASGAAVLAVQMVKELVSWFGDARSFAIQPSANPCLTSVPADHWKGEYFPNTTLSGASALVRDEAAASLGLSWGLGGPNTCGIGSDRFSARFTRTLNLSAGRYRFTARSDDGVRVWVDGQLLLDKWIVQAPTSYSFEVSLGAGSHAVRVEYFENDGEAVAQLSWEAVGGDPCQGSVPAERFRGEYFSNRDFAGAPVLVRDDGGAGLDFDWGSGSPSSACGVPADGFSARFTRTAAVRERDLSLHGHRRRRGAALRGREPEARVLEGPGPHHVHGGRARERGQPHAPPRLLRERRRSGGAARLGARRAAEARRAAASSRSTPASRARSRWRSFATPSPRLVKILDNFGPAAEIKAASPGTLIVGRIYEASQPSDGSPEQRAQEWWDRNRQRILGHPAVDYWEGYNEPGVEQHRAHRLVRAFRGGARRACWPRTASGPASATSRWARPT